jgi:hypothetical protein
MKIKFSLAALAITIGSASATMGQVQPPAWQAHGALKATPNSHYVQHEDGTPFLWVGDTAWGMMQYLTREEVDTYLDNRQKLGFSVIQTVAHWYPHGGGMKSGPANAPNAYGFRPFLGDDDKPDTSKPLTVPGGSPEQPNDYWDHADYIIHAARKRGLYVALLPTWGRAFISLQFGGTRKAYDDDKARTFGLFLGQRYRQEPHILWVMGGDAKAQIKGYDKNQVPVEFDGRSIYRAMAEGIAQGVTGKKANWNQKSPVWDQVFMTYHPDGDSWDNSSKWFHTDAWMDANGVEVWREVDDVFPVMMAEYQLENPVKPSLFLEGSYEFGSYRHECGWVTPVRVRRQFYQTFFAGGGGHTYGAGPIWAMRGSGGDYNCGYTWQQALHFPGAAQVASIGKAFLARQEWQTWVPNGRVLNGTGDRDSRKSAVVSTDGTRSLVYFANNSATRVKNLVGGAANAVWFDPRTGAEEDAGSFAADAVRLMAPPEGWEDAILVLSRSSAP